MEKQHDLENIKTENSKEEKIPIVINATKRDISSNAQSGTQGDIIQHDSDRMFLLSLLPYFRKVGDQRKQKLNSSCEKASVDISMRWLPFQEEIRNILNYDFQPKNLKQKLVALSYATKTCEKCKQIS
uniref:BESS domain-containing protein n=1 Tax=Glossina pallidipes TaxID=7398 RepID=A0A1A9ZDU4_GLOPL